MVTRTRLTVIRTLHVSLRITDVNTPKRDSEGEGHTVVLWTDRCYEQWHTSTSLFSHLPFVTHRVKTTPDSLGAPCGQGCRAS